MTTTAMTPTAKRPAAAQGGLYLATTSPQLVDVPDLTYLMIDGAGGPDGEEFALAMRALYQVSFGVRGELVSAASQLATPLEALWGASSRTPVDRCTTWRWTLMLSQVELPPSAVTTRLAAAVARVRGLQPPLPVDEVYYARLREGRCVQAMHIGPHDKVAATITRMLAHADARGYALCGRHHEIYLSDPDQTAPQWLRTIVRLPVTPQL